MTARAGRRRDVNCDADRVQPPPSSSGSRPQRVFVVKGTKTFTLNMLGKEHKGLAFTFFKPAALEGGKLSGQDIHKGANGAPILDAALAAVECKVSSIVEHGDHHIVVAEVVEAHVPNPIEGRLDSAILEMRDLGDNVYYGG